MHRLNNRHGRGGNLKPRWGAEEASHDPGAAAPKLLLRKPKASETQVGSAEQGAAAAPATAQEKKGKPPKAERVRSGHQVTADIPL